MPRREDHQSVRESIEYTLECIQHQGFFTLNGASADDHRAGATARNLPAQSPYNCRLGDRSYIELQVSADFYLVGRCADLDEPALVDLSLREEKINFAEYVRKQRLESAVTWKRSVRDPRVHNRDTCAAALRQAQEVWPELSFSDNHQPGAKDT